jgi:hypothetical protein
VPTAIATGPAATAAGTPIPATGRLLLRFTTCSHTCEPTPGTTFLDDGTMLWEAPDGSGKVLEAKLTEAGIATVRAAIEATPALATDGDYRATLRPGAEPIPHGLNQFRFDVQWEAGPVVVTSWDPGSIADQAELWIIPEAMPQLAALAQRLADPVAWLGPDAFVGGPVPYSPTGVLVRIDFFPDVGDIGVSPDVDDVDWPFRQPIETAGEPIQGADLPPPRCLVLDAAGAAHLRGAEFEAGAERDRERWETVVDYAWSRADGFVQVTVRHLLPYESGSCVDLLAGAP